MSRYNRPWSISVSISRDRYQYQMYLPNIVIPRIWYRYSCFCLSGACTCAQLRPNSLKMAGMKRCGDKTNSVKKLSSIMVQRMYPLRTGKQRKYDPEQARDFVNFSQYSKLSLENVKSAYVKICTGRLLVLVTYWTVTEVPRVLKTIKYQAKKSYLFVLFKQKIWTINNSINNSKSCWKQKCFQDFFFSYAYG